MRNRIQKKVIKTFTKKIFKSIEEGDLEQAETHYRFTVAKLDKASVRRVLHPNTARRRKSQLAIQYREQLEKVKTASE